MRENDTQLDDCGQAFMKYGYSIFGAYFHDCRRIMALANLVMRIIELDIVNAQVGIYD
jgi:hypothetical protein